MKIFLMSKGLWEAGAGGPGVTAIKEKQAHAAIVLNLSDSPLMHVIRTSSAQEVWTALDRFHRMQDMASRLWLKEKFASFNHTATDMNSDVTEALRSMPRHQGRVQHQRRSIAQR